MDRDSSVLREILINQKIPAALSKKNIYHFSVDWKEGGVDQNKHPQHNTYLKKFAASVVSNVESQIKTAITMKQKTIPQSEYYTEFDEGLHHLNFCKMKCDLFKGQGEMLLKIKSYLETNNKRRKPLVIHAESGIGKTSLMAMAMNSIHEWFGSDCVRMIRFLGTSPYSGDIYSLLRSVAGQLADTFGMIMEPVGYSNMKKLAEYFPRLLRNVSRRTQYQIFIFLDSIDQLSGTDNAYQMKWLPVNLPMKINIIISTLPKMHNILGNVQRLLTARECFLHLTPIPEQTGREIVSAYLAKKKRSITNEQRLILFSIFNENPSPLFLKLLLDFSLEWKSYTNIATLHAHLARSVTAAIHQLYDNLENRYGNILIKYAFGYITVGVNGLSEIELEDVLSCNDEVLDSVYQYHDPPVPGIVHIPPLLWARIRNDINEYTVERKSFGKTTIFWYHRQFIDSATKRYATGDIYTQLHKDLINMYMSERSLKRSITLSHRMKTIENADRQTTPQPLIAKNKRMLYALPYHLQESSDIQQLKRIALCNLKFMKTRIQAFSLDALLHDYSKALQDDGNSESDPELTLIRNCLHEIHGLSSVNQLPVQLLSRLVCNKNSTPNLFKLLNEAKEEILRSSESTLLPVYPCLSSEDMLLWSKTEYEKIIQTTVDLSYILVEHQQSKESRIMCVINTSTFQNSLTIERELNAAYTLSERGSLFMVQLQKHVIVLTVYEQDGDIVTTHLCTETSLNTEDITIILVSKDEGRLMIKYSWERMQLWGIERASQSMLLYDTCTYYEKVTINHVMFQNDNTLLFFIEKENGNHELHAYDTTTTIISLPISIEIDFNSVRLLNNTIRCTMKMEDSYRILNVDLATKTSIQSNNLHSELCLDQKGLYCYELDKGDCTLYDAMDGSYIKTVSIEGARLTSAACYGDGEYLVATDNLGRIVIWDTFKFKLLKHIKCHYRMISHISECNNLLLTQDVDNVIRMWSFSAFVSASMSNKSSQHLDISENSKLSNINIILNVLSVDSEEIVTIDLDGAIRIWNIYSERCIRTVSKAGCSSTLLSANIKGIRSILWLNKNTGRINFSPLTNHCKECTVSVLSDIPSNVETFTINDQQNRLLALVRNLGTNNSLSLYDLDLRNEGTVNTLQLKEKLLCVNVELKYTPDNKYGLIKMECTEKEYNIILASEKKGNLFPSSGKYKFAAIDLEKNCNSQLSYCNRMLTSLPCLGTCWETHLGNNVIIGKDRCSIFYDYLKYI